MFSFVPKGSCLKCPVAVTTAVFLLIYLSNGAFATENIPDPLRLVLPGVLAAGILVWKQGMGFRVQNRPVALLCAVLLLQLLTIACHGLAPDFDLSLILSILSAFCFATLMPFEDFVAGLRGAVFVITVGSVFFFLLGYIVPMYVDGIPDALLQPTKWDDAQTFLCTFVVRNKEWFTYYRSYGIFNEPGQYQIFLGLALIAELFHLNRPSWVVLAVLTAGYFVCNSANGLICAALIVAAYLWTSGAGGAARILPDLRGLSRPKQVLCLSAAAGLLALSVPYILSALTDAGIKIAELLSGAPTVESAADRLRAMETSFRIWVAHPLTGYGYRGMHEYQYHLNPDGMLMTCSPLNWFARFGTLYGLLANGGYLASFCRGLRRKGSILLMAAALLAMIAAQSVNSDMYMWVLIFYGWRKTEWVRI